ncbi:MAG: hypothetical protein J7539_17785 [Niabella sp.]|nr:hypothetical protein [Niabella sp.]
MKYILQLLMVCWSTTAFSQNLLDLSSWLPGSGSTAFFQKNGDDNENAREWGTGPNSSRVVLWKATPVAGNGTDGDGGWNSAVTSINPDAMYRLSIWIKKENSQGGLTYFGCAGANVAYLNNTGEGNPYFFYGHLPELNKWYLLVGYVHGSGDGSTENLGGIYDGVTGAKVLSCTDFKFLPGQSNLLHRSYLYYDSNTSDRQYFYGPRLEVVNGNEPSVASLLSGSGASMALNYVPGSLGIAVNPVPADYKLAVGGKVIAEEMKIKLQSSGWPDYVFKPSYQLTPLSQVESFIKQNGHLPEVPSAKEVGEKGVEMGASQAVLLKKIEELTLHLIAMEKKMTEQQIQLQQQKETNQSLVTEIKKMNKIRPINFYKKRL